MTSVAKRLAICGMLVMLVITAFLAFAWIGSTRLYQSDCFVIASPYTNAFSTPAFEASLMRTTTGILRLQVAPTFAGGPVAGTPAVRNGVGIAITCVGPTPADAQRIANEAWRNVQLTILTNYGGSVSIVQPASSARNYSFFHQRIAPPLRRLFKH